MFIVLSGEGLRMLEQERVKLLFGPYRTPKCKIGRHLRCVMRGKVTVAGLSVPRFNGHMSPSLGAMAIARLSYAVI
jgi:hypothetical protein